MRLPRDWDALAADHAAAVQQFVLTVQQLAPDSWSRPLAPGKWTPAEVTSHLAESYRILRAELAGGPGMALRLSGFRRWVLRHTILPRILRGGIFPAGARAPRETRPRELIEDATTALRTLTLEADAFAQDLTTRASSGRVHLNHAYFGPMSARQSLRLVAVHTRHHARQVAGIHP
ncbi:MAG TPA: DinB family protein [Gemmatimonadales bacterium]|nr:DinB family protein [Gemmatimonadales bacterium]